MPHPPRLIGIHRSYGVRTRLKQVLVSSSRKSHVFQWEEVILVVLDSREGQHVFVDLQHDGRALNVEEGNVGKSRIGYNLGYPGHTSFFLGA